MAKVRLDKSKKAKPAAKGKAKPPAPPLTPEQRQTRRKVLSRLVNGLALAVVVGGSCIGYNALASHVRETYALVSRPPAVTLLNRPAWMGDAIAADLARRVATALPPSGSTLDHDLLVRVGGVLAEDAWIARVARVRRLDVRGRDTLQIECDYRTPLAIVQWRDGRETSYRLIARDGVLLPPTYSGSAVHAIVAGRDATTNLRVITGVAAPPPPGDAGLRWDAPDLKAGLDVAALLNGLAAAQNVTVIDVDNFAERRVRWTAGAKERWAAQIVLRTKLNHVIFWGRPPEADDFLVEVSPQTKLANLTAVAKHFQGRPWPAWVDLRAENDAAIQYDATPAEEAGFTRPPPPSPRGSG